MEHILLSNSPNRHLVSNMSSEHYLFISERPLPVENLCSEASHFHLSGIAIFLTDNSYYMYDNPRQDE